MHRAWDAKDMERTFQTLRGGDSGRVLLSELRAADGGLILEMVIVATAAIPKTPTIQSMQCFYMSYSSYGFGRYRIFGYVALGIVL